MVIYTQISKKESIINLQIYYRTDAMKMNNVEFQVYSVTSATFPIKIKLYVEN